jgi:hypothetical protein
MSKAQRYGLSDVGRAKICRKLRVAVPYRGYLAQERSRTTFSPHTTS